MNIRTGFVAKYKLSMGVTAVFLFLLGCFIAANPKVFLDYRAYTAVFTSLGASIIMATSVVFVVASGELDLSFPSVIGLSAWLFAVIVKIGGGPALGFVAALLLGCGVGVVNGVLVTKVRLSSLVATLGMNFLIRGLIMILTNGLSISLPALRETTFFAVFAGQLGNFPVQMLWSIGFAVVYWLIFNRHRFGGHVCYIGDNTTSAREMGIRVDRVKILTFVLIGFSSGFSGVLLTLINTSFWPTTGDGYLLPTLAAVFLGGTPTWGGVGTVYGAVVGAFILGFVDTGIVASGLTGFYKQFFYGLILILALISHRYVGLRRR
jgi:ribose/xylose/arabinose/galactoside ABC-type transport system permease subunit